MKIYMYICGENPMKYFYRRDRKATSNMCWFSTRLGALAHFYDNVSFELYEQIDDAEIMRLDTSSLKDMERFYKLYVEILGYCGDSAGKDGCGPAIIEVELDQKFTD